MLVLDLLSLNEALSVLYSTTYKHIYVASSFGCPNAFGLAGKILLYRIFGIRAIFARVPEFLVVYIHT